ncbi:alpha/beta fold hydrolase [Haloarchaeobius amylolyticus]|uniref:Alpha/beta fold hydrolase n=1 Tax=Haloarchaeobius amylolyticus TaxID=1198296 RepID=A0ABD6BBS1_9EURY
MDEGEEAEQSFTDVMALLDNGKEGEALVLFLQDVVHLLPEEFDLLRASPYWQDQVKLMQTVPLEMQAVARYEFEPAQFENMTTPALLLGGSESSQPFREGIDLLDDMHPNSEVAIMDGGGHIRLATAPEQFLDEVLGFIREPN